MTDARKESKLEGWRTLVCVMFLLAGLTYGSAGQSPSERAQFESIAVPPITDIREGMNGVALADLNRDGFVDIVATYAEPEMQRTGRGTQLRVFLNDGHFRFRERKIVIHSREVSPTSFGGRAQVPVLADFNKDGFLDILVTRSAPMTGGKLLPRANVLGNTFLISEGRWDVFSELSGPMGIRNDTAYNRQASFGDVNKDGWLDIAVGSDNIGNANWGLPLSRLYVFQPKGSKFEDGTFKDLGGTNLIPDFGGFYHDSARDKAGPDINLSDLDNDNDLDLLQSYHVDCRQPGLPYSPCEYRQGMFVWRNMLTETGQFRFTQVTDNGLAEIGKLKYDASRKVYQPVRVGAGLPYVSLADVNNDSLLDVVAVGPSDPGWSPSADYAGGRFWYNLGGFRFRGATDVAGLGALDWTYRQWAEFFGGPIRTSPRAQAARPQTTAQPGLTRGDPQDTRPYYADAVFVDVDNDGWLDLVVPDIRERPGRDVRSMLFMNRGDGTFKPEPTTFSGLQSGSINVEAADLDNDGLVDLIFAADPDNTGDTKSLDRYETKIYRNTGAHGGRQNHWIRTRFSGVTDAALIGARVEVRGAGVPKLLGTRIVSSKQNYKSGSPLEAHFGLGAQAKVDIDVVLLSGKKISFPSLAADRFLELDLASGKTSAIAPR
jgi:hypothetical protein